MKKEKEKQRSKMSNLTWIQNMMNCKKNGWVKLINILTDCKELLTPSVING